MLIVLAADHEDMEQMPFFLPGPASPAGSFTYTARQNLFIAQASVPLTNRITYLPALDIRREGIGRSDDPDSVRVNFGEQTAPGLASQPTFVVVHNAVDLHDQHQMCDVEVGSSVVHDTDSGHYSFGEVSANATYQYHLRTGGSLRKQLPCFDPRMHPRDKSFGTLHLSAAVDHQYVGQGNAIPFYMQTTLGGSNINGQETLRSYDNYRFRDPDLVMFQAEYWKGISGVYRTFHPIPKNVIARYLIGMSYFYSFYDAGKVASQFSGLDIAHLRQDGGAGIRFTVANNGVFTVYLAYGAGHGSHPNFHPANVFPSGTGGVGCYLPAFSGLGC
jgi:hypothetical protein